MDKAGGRNTGGRAGQSSGSGGSGAGAAACSDGNGPLGDMKNFLNKNIPFSGKPKDWDWNPSKASGQTGKKYPASGKWGDGSSGAKPLGSLFDSSGKAKPGSKDDIKNSLGKFIDDLLAKGGGDAEDLMDTMGWDKNNAQSKKNEMMDAVMCSPDKPDGGDAANCDKCSCDECQDGPAAGGYSANANALKNAFYAKNIPDYLKNHIPAFIPQAVPPPEPYPGYVDNSECGSGDASAAAATEAAPAADTWTSVYQYVSNPYSLPITSLQWNYGSGIAYIFNNGSGWCPISAPEMIYALSVLSSPGAKIRIVETSYQSPYGGIEVPPSTSNMRFNVGGEYYRVNPNFTLAKKDDIPDLTKMYESSVPFGAFNSTNNVVGFPGYNSYQNNQWYYHAPNDTTYIP